MFGAPARDGDDCHWLIPDVASLHRGEIDYGPVISTHDVYAWDATAQAGTAVSLRSPGCDGGPGGSNTYPLTLARM